jgi:hypothetical protein
MGGGKRKNNRRVRRNIDRNVAAGPWRPLVACETPQEAKDGGVVATFQNHRYTVFVKETVSPVMKMENGDPMPIVHLIIIRNDKKDLRSWDDIQRIKNELCNPMSDAVELFPAEWRRQPMTQTHIWATPPGMTFPVGLLPEMGAGGMDALTKADIEVYAIPWTDEDGNEKFEVFADEEEAREGYKENGLDFPRNGTIQRIGDAEPEGDSAVWTDKAKAKVAKVLAHSKTLDDIDAAALPDEADDDGSVFEDWAEGEPEPIEEDMEFGPMPPPSDEEIVLLMQNMERGIASRARAREVALAEAQREFEEREAQEAEKESEANDELAAMRRKLVATGKIDGGEEPQA